jgi:hypothetical protein
MTAWYDEKMPEKMMQTNFPHILDSDHFGPLVRCINSIPVDVSNLVDLGCGKAEISDVFLEYEYFGADLPHIIKNVSKVLKPSLNYIEFDAIIDSMDFVSSFDVVLMNSFLSEIESADDVLRKVLKHAPRYVVIHRQEIEDKMGIEEYITYGGLKTIKYIFGKRQLEEILEEYGFNIFFETKFLYTMNSFVLERISQ